MGEEILSIKDLRVSYLTRRGEVKAVDGVSLGLYKGEILGIAGESGCGKSTLAAAILRLVKPPGIIKEGKVLYRGKDLLKLGEEEFRLYRMTKIAYVPQGSMNSLNPVMRIRDQFMDMLKDHGLKIKKEELEERLREILSSMGLKTSILDRYPHELSGGMKQRTLIALSLIMNPEILIADEPTTALDVVSQRGVMNILRDLKDQRGTSIILITHDMAVQAELSDRMAIMYAGKIVEVGPTEEIYNEPLHPYTRLLIESIPSLGDEKPRKSIEGIPPDLVNPPKGCRFHPRCPFYIPGKCDTQEPMLIQISGGRGVACLLYS
ncbi:MAG: ABC transporter ATP-binding protein [Desulfurococcales archaeon]|jgi:peptide/nickel transport system ATP-binding protein